MSQDQDKLPDNVSCINAEAVPFTLISTLGFHCDVWRSIGKIVTAERSSALDCVVKIGSQRCTRAQVRVLAKEHRILKQALGELVPAATFIATRIDREPRALVLAQACAPWFDLGNPTNESESLPMLARQPRLRQQLRDFTQAARHWLDDKRMLIDLVGAENLVLDRNGGVRYVDSFHVFFYLDTLDVIDQVDDEFLLRIEQSVERLGYLEWLLVQSSSLASARES